MPTKIAWARNPDGSAGETWNPVTGCTPVSEGCAHCYARTFAERWRGVPGHPYEQGFDLKLHPDRLDIPLKRQKPTTYFVCSMGDLFHEDVPDEFIDRVFATMAICGAERQTCKWAGCDHDERSGCWQDGEGRSHSRHTFQVLTKRPHRMLEYLSGSDRSARVEAVGNDPEWSIQWEEPQEMIFGQRWPLPNVWLGVSVENQARADERIPLLLETPAAVRFVSCEPLLGPLDLTPWLSEPKGKTALRGYYQGPGGTFQMPPTDVKPPLLDWVIVGGESGGPPERRLVERCEPHRLRASRAAHRSGGCTFLSPADCADCNGTGWHPKPEALRWVRDIRDQCQAAGVALWFKQWGPRAGQGTEVDGRKHKEMPRQEVRA